MIFCTVDANLCRILKDIAGTKLIVNCGAGEDGLHRMLSGVMAIDLFPPENMPEVTMADAITFPFPTQSLPVFLRPCHSAWVHDTITRNINRLREFVYVGLPENLERDFDDESENYTICLYDTDWRGQEGERVYMVKSKIINGEPVRKYYLIRNNHFPAMGASWFIDCESWPGYYENLAGGRQPKTDYLEVLRTVETVESELCWLDTYLDRPESSAGWLDRSGNFFGCKYRDHDMYASYILGVWGQSVLEDLGWVKVCGAPGSFKDALGDFVLVNTDLGLSTEQYDWLHKQGYNLSPQEQRRKAIKLKF